MRYCIICQSSIGGWILDNPRHDFISNESKIGVNFKTWELTKIRENTSIGSDVNIGRNVYIGPGVIIGNSVKIQNNALIYEPTIIEDGVFVGPSVIITNDKNPRAINPNMQKKEEMDWIKSGVRIKKGASIGAGSIIVAPVTIGKWAMVGAGSVVIEDVRDFSMVYGNPARFRGWVGKHGNKLIKFKKLNKNYFKCPITNEIYIENDKSQLKLVDFDEI